MELIKFGEKGSQYFIDWKNQNKPCGIYDFCEYVGIPYHQFITLLKFVPSNSDFMCDTQIYKKIDTAKQFMQRILADLERRTMAGEISPVVYMHYIGKYGDVLE